MAKHRSENVQAFEVSDERASELFDAALDAVVGMNGRGLVIAWNKQAESIFGWRRDEAIGKKLADLIIPEDFRQNHHDGLVQYHKTGVGPVLNQRIQVAALRKDGCRIPVELSIIPLKTGEEPSFYGFLRDLSHEKALELRAERVAARDKLLVELAIMAAEAGDFRELLRRSLATIGLFAKSDCGHIYLPDHPTDPTTVQATDLWYLSADVFNPIKEITSARELRIGEGLPGRVWESGEPAWIVDLSKDENFYRKDEFLKLGIRSGFGFPVKQGDRLLAIFEFFSSDNWEPGDDDATTILRVSSHLGRVFERQHALEQSQMLSRELAHRVGNILAIVSAVFERSVTHAESVHDLAKSFRARMQALKVAQTDLSSANWEKTTLRELAHRLLAPYCSSETGNFELRGDEVALNATLSMTLSLVLHELAVNAAKYGALSAEGGQLVLQWEVTKTDAKRMLVLNWQETGGPVVSPPSRSGFGSNLIDSLVKTAMRGEVTRTFDRGGFSARLTLPL